MLILAGAGLLLALLCVEATLRVLDPFHYTDDDMVVRFAHELRDTRPIAPALSSFYLRPNAHIEFLGQTFDINDRGYRTPLLPYEKPDDVYRIVVVGDSVPFGWGVAEKDCFPRRLEMLLNEHPHPFGKRRVEVVNLSGPGRGLGDYLIVLDHEATKYHPDRIIVPLIFNDIPLMEVVPAEERPAPVPQLPQWLHSIWTARLFHILYLQVAGYEMTGDYWLGIRSSPRAIAAFPIAFESFKAAAKGTPILLLDTIGEAPGHGVQEVAAAAAAAGLDRIECFLDLADWPTKWAIHSPKHNHPNPAAHDRYAHAILDWLAQHGL